MGFFVGTWDFTWISLTNSPRDRRRHGGAGEGPPGPPLHHLLPQQPQHGMAHFKGRTWTKLKDAEVAAVSARIILLTFLRCCSVVVRPALKLPRVGTGSAAAPRAKNSTSPVVFPVEDTYGKLRVNRYCWRRPRCPASPPSVPPTILKAKSQNVRVMPSTWTVVHQTFSQLADEPQPREFSRSAE